MQSFGGEQAPLLGDVHGGRVERRHRGDDQVRLLQVPGRGRAGPAGAAADGDQAACQGRTDEGGPEAPTDHDVRDPLLPRLGLTQSREFCAEKSRKCLHSERPATPGDLTGRTSHSASPGGRPPGTPPRFAASEGTRLRRTSPRQRVSPGWPGAARTTSAVASSDVPGLALGRGRVGAQHPERGRGHGGQRLADSGQRGRGPGGHRDVVEADHAEVVGRAQAALAQGLEDAERLGVVAGHDGGGRVGQPEQVAALALAALDR